jgi:PIN domain nuclease of toxin-antitoxin system
MVARCSRAARRQPARPAARTSSRNLHLAVLHKDPFDRVLIAQAIAEQLELVTIDSEIPRYSSASFQVVS